MKLQGIWTGYYEYGIGYDLPYFGERVHILVEISGDMDQFEGTVKEQESEFSVPYSGKIKGFVDEDFVSFIKTYPIRPVISDDMSKMSYNEGELEIEHSGYFDIKNGAMYGSWSIPQDVEGDEVYNYGTWLLKPVK